MPGLILCFSIRPSVSRLHLHPADLVSVVRNVLSVISNPVLPRRRVLSAAAGALLDGGVPGVVASLFHWRRTRDAPDRHVWPVRAPTPTASTAGPELAQRCRIAVRGSRGRSPSPDPNVDRLGRLAPDT